MNPISWECPYCGRPTTITREDVDSFDSELIPSNSEGRFKVYGKYVVCPNPVCKRPVITLSIYKGILNDRSQYEFITLTSKPIYQWNLLPKSLAKPMPDYIPTAVIDDYSEACSIEELSPKASATLARRALQGMVRDFWKVEPYIISRKGKKVFKNLSQELDEIKDKVDPTVWDAITGIREIGNIGAHMEEDINKIIDIDQGEVRILITLIETLIKEWYVSRKERSDRILAVSSIAQKKRDEKVKTAS